jgi:hypothetical protein
LQLPLLNAKQRTHVAYPDWAQADFCLSLLLIAFQQFVSWIGFATATWFSDSLMMLSSRHQRKNIFNKS